MIDYKMTNIINAALHLDLKSKDGLEKFKKVVRDMLDEETLRSKALVVIEHIALMNDEESETLSNVYRASHVANGDCLNAHEDWKKWVEEAYVDLVARGEHEEDKGKHRKKMQAMTCLHVFPTIPARVMTRDDYVDLGGI